MTFIFSMVRYLGFGVVACAMQCAQANDPSSPSAGGAQNMAKPEQQIVRVLKSQFDRPDAALTVNPVVVEGDYAVAGWFQKDKGGRALLHLFNGQWTVTVCGGDGLRQAQTLKLAGMQAKSADLLSKKVMDAEAKLTKAQLKQLSSFGEVVKVESTGHHDAGGHQKHH